MESKSATIIAKVGKYWQIEEDASGKTWYLLPQQFIDKDRKFVGSRGYLTYRVSGNLGAHYFSNRPIEE